jgi:hypothetical protein
MRPDQPKASSHPERVSSFIWMFPQFGTNPLPGHNSDWNFDVRINPSEA